MKKPRTKGQLLESLREFDAFLDSPCGAGPGAANVIRRRRRALRQLEEMEQPWLPLAICQKPTCYEL